jgi:molybdopterin synthase catalytic subunit
MTSVIAKVVRSAIAHESLSNELSDPGDGAQVVFWGLVRNVNDGRSVVAVTYDVCAPIAEKTFRDIGEEARNRWGEDLRVVIIHRAGRLVVGEASVAIGVGSPHRDEAYQASRYIIEQLKVRSPIWKQEHYVDGDSEWLAGHPLSAGGTGSGPARDGKEAQP